MAFHWILPVFMLLPATASAAETLDPVYDAALTGDGVAAIDALSHIDANSLDANDAARATCIQNALLSPPQLDTLPPLSNSLLLAYRSYWQQSMMRRESSAAAETQLKNRLDAILTPINPATKPSGNLDVASDRAKAAVERDGLFALTGVTAPYYELAIWKTQSPRTYSVDLHDRRVRTQVVFLDDFASFGWAGFATCDRYHSAGWATRSALFAVRSAYDLDSENFRVSYLAHESRHLSDYRRFPRLQQPELEYRAKLTELTLADESAHGLIATFARRAGHDRASPHSFANYWVAKNMSKTLLKSDVMVDDTDRWDAISTTDIRAAATRLLAANDARLMKSRPGTVERFLGD